MTNHHPERPSTAGPSRRHIFAAAAVGALLVIALSVLAYGHLQKTERLEQAYTEINKVHTLHAELDASYQNAMAELEALKGDNAEMNALIEAQQAELEAQRNEIAAMLKDRRRLNQARAQLDELKAQVAGYLAELDQLRAEQETLALANEQLSVEKQQLFNDLSNQVMVNTQLSEARVQLVSQNEELARAVHIGSVVKVHDVRVEGLKVRNNGKLVGKRSARKVDQLNICFTTFTNEVVQPGTEEFFVRIVNPRGETLAIENLGSGSISLEASDEDIRYTQTAATDYQNDEQDLCLRWNPDISFLPGQYEVEIYNKGYLAGASTFELK